MDASCGGRGHHQVPGCFQDSGRPELLPERDVKFAAGRAALYQPAHDNSFGHPFIIGDHRIGGRSMAGWWASRTERVVALKYE
jgi:hypothetical protein